MTVTRPASISTHTPRGTFYHLSLSAAGVVSAIVTTSDPHDVPELAGPAELVRSSSDGPCVKLRDTRSGRVVRLSIDPDDLAAVTSMFDQSLPVADRIPFADLNIDDEGDVDDDSEDDDCDDNRCGFCNGSGCYDCNHTGRGDG